MITWDESATDHHARRRQDVGRTWPPAVWLAWLAVLGVIVTLAVLEL